MTGQPFNDDSAEPEHLETEYIVSGSMMKMEDGEYELVKPTGSLRHA